MASPQDDEQALLAKAMEQKAILDRTERAIAPYKVGSDPNFDKGVRDGKYVLGRLKIFKSWNSGLAFVANRNFPCDVVVETVDNRFHALHGDIVAVELFPKKQWKSRGKRNNMTAKAVAQAGQKEEEKVAEGEDEDGEVQKVEEDPLAKEIATAAQELNNEFGAEEGVLPDGRHIVKFMKDETPQEAKENQRTDVRLGVEIGAPTTYTWPEGMQPTGKIVYVLERKAELVVAARMRDGALKPDEELKDNKYYQFQSYNALAPTLAVYGRDIPEQFRKEVADQLFLVQIEQVDKNIGTLTWIEDRMPKCKLLLSLGKGTTVVANSHALCASYNVDMADFSEEAYGCIAETFTVPSAEELKRTHRRDLRDSEFVCTIDPATARDLDDGLSIARTPGGYRIGVHIADVSHFVTPNSALDEEAQKRCNSTYLVEQVISMLPRKLSEDYCSLNPGEDKFAFSAIFNMDSEGKIISEWFGKSVIRNRCRMAYEDAQRVIDGDLSGDSLQIHETELKQEGTTREKLVRKVVESLQTLYELASKLRAVSMSNGRLAIGNAKLSFTFEDMNSRLAPKGFFISRQIEANWVVEEFMLLANRRVAEKIVQFQPSQAMLRRHPPPLPKKMVALRTALEKNGYTMHGFSGKALQDMIEAKRDDKYFTAISAMVKYSLKPAEYFANSTLTDEDSYRAHFALALPWYTHFTSPIRRYCDVIVHRQLLVSLEIEQLLKERAAEGNTRAAAALAGRNKESTVEPLHPEDLIDPSTLKTRDNFYPVSFVNEVADNANEKKDNSRKVSDASLQLFFCIYLEALRRSAPYDSRIPEIPRTEVVVVRMTASSFTVFSEEIASEVSIGFKDNNQKFKVVTDENGDEEHGVKDGKHGNHKQQKGGRNTRGKQRNGGKKQEGGEEQIIKVSWGGTGESAEIEEIKLLATFTATLRVTTQKGCMTLEMIIDPPSQRESFYNGYKRIPTVLAKNSETAGSEAEPTTA